MKFHTVDSGVKSVQLFSSFLDSIYLVIGHLMRLIWKCYLPTAQYKIQIWVELELLMENNVCKYFYWNFGSVDT